MSAAGPGDQHLGGFDLVWLSRYSAVGGIALPICVNAVSDSCAAPEASSAPVAIWSAERFSSSAAEAASLIPDDSSPVAAATRSAACCCLPRVRAFLALGFRLAGGDGRRLALGGSKRVGLADVFDEGHEIFPLCLNQALPEVREPPERLPCNVELLKMRGDPWHSSSPAAQARMTAVPQLLRGIGSPDARWIAAAGQSRRDIARTSQSAFCRTIPHGALREFERGMARLGHCRDLPESPLRSWRIASLPPGVRKLGPLVFCAE
jgi:hypothetical protein